MRGHEVTTDVDVSELMEAKTEFSLWLGRTSEIPLHLRAECEAINRLEGSAFSYVEISDGRASVVLSPRVRALVANLRAQRRCRG